MKTEMDELKKNLHEAITTICKDYETKHLPEFKVGQWIIGKDGYFPNYPTRILSITNDYADLDITNGKDFRWKNEKGLFWSPATPSEIESHLRKICDEKYIGKNVTCLRVNTWPDFPIQRVESFFEYNAKEDQLSYKDAEDRAIFIYIKGKFAEIIPDKKSLPKTKWELEEILNKFQKDALLPFPQMDVSEFLNEYED